MVFQKKNLNRRKEGSLLRRKCPDEVDRKTPREVALDMVVSSRS